MANFKALEQNSNYSSDSNAADKFSGDGIYILKYWNAVRTAFFAAPAVYVI